MRSSYSMSRPPLFYRREACRMHDRIGDRGDDRAVLLGFGAPGNPFGVGLKAGEFACPLVERVPFEHVVEILVRAADRHRPEAGLFDAVLLPQRLGQRVEAFDQVGQTPGNAVVEADETHIIDTLAGPRIFTRRQGEPLHPARESLPMLEQIRRTIGEYNFAGQYQQAPAPLGGGMVKAAWFRYYTQDELPAQFERIVQSWDTASKATELSDFSVCTSWGIQGKELYLLDVLRRRMEYPELKRAVRDQYALYRPGVDLIEDKASGTQLIQELVADGLHAVTRYQPRHDKIMRMHAQTAMIENGFVHLPKEAAWLAEYLHELTSFPKGNALASSWKMPCTEAGIPSRAIRSLTAAVASPSDTPGRG